MRFYSCEIGGDNENLRADQLVSKPHKTGPRFCITHIKLIQTSLIANDSSYKIQHYSLICDKLFLTF